MPACSICRFTRSFAVAAHGRFRVCNRFGHPHIVDRPLGAEPIDRGVHGVGVVSLACEPLPDLRLGELPTAEHPETVHVRTARLWAFGLSGFGLQAVCILHADA